MGQASCQCLRRKAITRLMRGRVTVAHDERECSQAVLLVDASSASSDPPRRTPGAALTRHVGGLIA
jgi:hypothetical protein